MYSTLYCPSAAVGLSVIPTVSLANLTGGCFAWGKPTDPHVRALLFQNYEGSVPTLKAGFLLPEEISQSEILISNLPRSMSFRSVGSRDSVGLILYREIFRRGITVVSGHTSKIVALVWPEVRQHSSMISCLYPCCIFFYFLSWLALHILFLLLSPRFSISMCRY